MFADTNKIAMPVIGQSAKIRAMDAPVAPSFAVAEDAARKQLTAALARVAAGDRAALKLLYRDSSAKLFAVCLRILQDRSEAEDVLQEVYLTVWQRAGAFDAARASPMTWLVAVARNRAIDRLRSGAKLRRVKTIDDVLDVADSAADALAQMEDSEDRQRLMDCLGELESRHAGAIRAAFFEGMTYADGRLQASGGIS